MTWKCYLTIFKSKSPIHIGYKQIGIFKTTRYYITGKVMWGAITANLTRSLYDNPSAKDYQRVGELVRNYIKNTYFYPAIEKNKIKNPSKWSDIEVDNYLVLLPEYTEECLIFGKLNKEEFENVFVGSFVSTAIDIATKSAEEGSLHEFEFMKDRIIYDEKLLDVYWIGYLFVKDGTTIDGMEIKCEDNEILIKNKNRTTRLLKIIDFIQVGGERNYGFGKLKLQKFQINNDKIFKKYNFEYINNYITFKDISTVFSHINLDGIALKRGEIEPVIGLEWCEKGGPGQKLSDVKLCATPGSVLESYCDVIMKDYGIAEVKK